MRFMTIFRLLDVARVALKGRGGFENRAPLLSLGATGEVKKKIHPGTGRVPTPAPSAAASAVRAGRGQRPPSSLAQHGPAGKPRDLPKVTP